jgi:hypothetical protein
MRIAADRCHAKGAKALSPIHDFRSAPSMLNVECSTLSVRARSAGVGWSRTRSRAPQRVED